MLCVIMLELHIHDYHGKVTYCCVLVSVVIQTTKMNDKKINLCEPRNLSS